MISIRDGGFGKRTIFDPSPFGPLILEDAGTVAHVYWNGSALVDTKTNAWTQNGTVPQIAKSGRTPPGAGPFSGANYYSIANPSMITALTGDFMACVVFASSGIATETIASDCGTVIDVDGWRIYTLAGLGSVVQMRWPSGANQVTTGNVTTALNAVTWGRQGGVATTGYVKLNLGTTVSAAVAQATPTNGTTRLGLNAGATQPATALYEFWASSTAFSEAGAAAIQARIKYRAGITAW